MGKFELDKKGVSALLKSQEMMSICQSHAERMAASDPGPHKLTTHVGRTRVNAEVMLTGADVARRKAGMTGG